METYSVSLEKNYRTSSVVLAQVAFFVGVLVLIGWYFEIPALIQIRSTWAPMKENTALSFVALGLGLSIFGHLHPDEKSQSQRIAAFVLGIIPLVFGCNSLFEHLTGIDSGLDQMFSADFYLATQNPNPGRISIPTSLSLVFLSLSFFCNFSELKKLAHLRDAFATSAILTTAPALIGYIYGIRDQFSIQTYTHVAFHTSLAVSLMAIAIPMARPDVGFFSPMLRKKLGGDFLREAMPFAVLVPLVLGWFRLEGEDVSLYDAKFGLTLGIIASMVVLTGLIWLAGRKLDNAYNRIAQSKKLMDAIVSNLDTIMFSIDKSGVITFAQGKGKTASGLPVADNIGRSIYELHRERPDLLEKIEAALNGERQSFIYIIAGFWHELHFEPVFDGRGNVTGITGVTYNVHERVLSDKALAQSREQQAKSEIGEKAALETSRLKSEFLANMSHEIRTPINGVIGMTGLLVDTALTDEQRGYADAIKKSGESLLTLINDILDVSKIEAGKLEFEEIDFSLNDAIDDIRKTLAFAADAKQIDLRTDIPSNLPTTVNGDPGRLKQVLLNLMNNAIKFTVKGEVTLRVAKVSQQMDRVRLRFEVIDTGVGIPANVINRIFLPFSQADASTQKKYGGTGLGLSISKNLVEKMDGAIGVISEEGKGSTFWFEVILKNSRVVKQIAVVDKIEPVKQKRTSDRRLRVLVAEDNSVNQLITSRMLQKLGYHVDIVANGLEVLNILATVPYDLILMDIQMPEMDGYEATMRIRASQSLPNPNILILAMTANAMADDEKKCLKAGMNGHIAKPVGQDKLAKILDFWLGTAA